MPKDAMMKKVQRMQSLAEQLLEMSSQMMDYYGGMDSDEEAEDMEDAYEDDEEEDDAPSGKNAKRMALMAIKKKKNEKS